MKRQNILLTILLVLVLLVGGHEYFRYVNSSRYIFEGSTVHIKSGDEDLKIEKVTIEKCVYLILTSKRNNAILSMENQPDECYEKRQ